MKERKHFARTIDAGSSMLDELLADLKAAGKDTVEGKDIFKLYDTYGFPVELTEELAEDKGFKIDHAGFEAAMKETTRNVLVPMLLKAAQWVCKTRHCQASLKNQFLATKMKSLILHCQLSSL